VSLMEWTAAAASVLVRVFLLIGVSPLSFSLSPCWLGWLARRVAGQQDRLAVSVCVCVFEGLIGRAAVDF
jgi:hypothetical protein